MPSKLVVDRFKRSLLVMAATREHAGRVQAAWTAEAKSLLRPGESLPDLGFVMEILARGLERDMLAMQEAAERHEHELGDDAEPRDRRDHSAADLNTSLDDLREILRGLFGTGVLAGLHLEVAPPREPAAVSAYAKSVIGALGTATFPAPRIPKAKFVARTWVKRLEKERETLEAALKDVAREQREAEGTLADKNATIVAHDRTQARVAAVASGLLEFAGEPELAERVRPSERKGRGGNEGEAGKDDAGEQPAGEKKP